MRPNSSCAAPMSITASAVPPAATLAGHLQLVPCVAARAAASSPAFGRRFRRQAQCARAGVEEHLARREQREAVGTGRGLRHQRGRDGRQHQRIDADRRASAAWRSPASAKPWNSTTGLASATCGCRASLLEQGLVEAALRGAQFQVGLAVDRAHRARELVERRGIDQLHREGQRHAQHHGQHGGRVAPGVVAEFLPGEGGEQCAHRAIVAARAVLHRRGTMAPLRRRLRNPTMRLLPRALYRPWLAAWLIAPLLAGHAAAQLQQP